MNRQLLQTLRIARWEFRRFFKWKDGLILFAFMLGGIFVAQLFEKVFEDRPPEGVRLLVVDPTAQWPVPPGDDSFSFEPLASKDVAEGRSRLLAETADGLLIVHPGDSLELVTDHRPGWLDALEDQLGARRDERRLAPYQLTPATVDSLLAPLELTLTPLDPEKDRHSRGARIFTAVLVGLMLMGVWIGSAQIFVAITGEKQNRVTEYILSAVSPQTWIDGKILGMAAMGVAYIVFFLALAMTLVMALNATALFTLPVTWTLSVGSALLTLLLISLGYLFWFTFTGAIAATVNDPNSSGKGVFIMLPFLPMALGLGALKNPDSTLMTVLSYVPFTSPTVIPTRLAMTDVPAWEVMVSVVVLAGSIALLRRYAGAVFALGILMTGKEPTWAEIMRWVRKV